MTVYTRSNQIPSKFDKTQTKFAEAMALLEDIKLVKVASRCISVGIRLLNV